MQRHNSSLAWVLAKTSSRDCSLRLVHASPWPQSELACWCCLQWATITVVLVSAPVVGRVARTGLERMMGTILGEFQGVYIQRTMLHACAEATLCCGVSNGHVGQVVGRYGRLPPCPFL